jgi:hypothetical protein
MTDRALILFTDGKSASPAIFLCSLGSAVPSLLGEAAMIITGPDAPAPEGPEIDEPTYAASIFARVCPTITTQEHGFKMVEELKDLSRAAASHWGAPFDSIEGMTRAQANLALRRIGLEMGLEAGLVLVDVRPDIWAWRPFCGHLLAIRPRDCGFWRKLPHHFGETRPLPVDLPGYQRLQG